MQMSYRFIFTFEEKPIYMGFNTDWLHTIVSGLTKIPDI